MMTLQNKPNNELMNISISSGHICQSFEVEIGTGFLKNQHTLLLVEKVQIENGDKMQGFFKNYLQFDGKNYYMTPTMAM